MTDRIRLDHIALAVPRLADSTAVLVGELGGAFAFGAVSRFYNFGQWRFAGGGRLEVLEPRGDDGFLRRFLDQYGPGVHHVTFTVPDLRAACARAEAHGYTIVGFDDSNPAWAEAFLHPKQALGIVVQLAESRNVPGARQPARWTPPPGPDDPPPPVTVLGLRLSAASIQRARTQWELILKGEPTEGEDGAIVYRWPRSPLRLTVEIDPSRVEGPIGIELTTGRPLGLAGGRHPLLGAVFMQRR